MRWPAVIVGSLLAVMLAAAAVLTIDSRRAERAARDNAARVLRDYASFAAWQYARVATRGLEQALNAAVVEQPVHARTGGPEAAGCNCEPDAAGVIARFQIEPAARTWIAGRPSTDAYRAAIEAAVGRAAGSAHQRPQFVILPRGEGAVGWHMDTKPTGPAIAHGVLVNPAFLATALRAAAASEPVLPPALVKSADAMRLLALRASAADGRVLFESHDAPWRMETASNPVSSSGGLVVAASLSPEAASHLIIGGMPQPRLFAIYALLGLAAALVLTAGYQMRREAELARLRADFVSGVSHELRTPLAQIRMFAETLRLGRVRSPEESSRALDIILQESRRLSDLVDKVLVFSRGERTSHRIERQPASLSDLVLEIADDLRPMAAAKQVSLATRVERSIEGSVDRDALRQVILNLVDNALKYGPAGQTITIGLLREADAARLWVEDQGPGIPQADMRRIWEPFWRRGKSGQGGSGIGLSIVRDLVRLHDGRVFVDPACATGARFVVTLPA